VLHKLMRWLTRRPEWQSNDVNYEAVDKRLVEMERRQQDIDARLRLLDTQADIRGYRQHPMRDHEE
jgi:hypothetical protein